MYINLWWNHISWNEEPLTDLLASVFYTEPCDHHLLLIQASLPEECPLHVSACVGTSDVKKPKTEIHSDRKTLKMMHRMKTNP